ncbi:MAG: transcription antitermination factor NusB [Hyphomicrobiales bacterium]|nr:transcription antitermination factor NusB [Hyphomicrobiales bacterium]
MSELETPPLVVTRYTARLAAVQALYQMDLVQTGVKTVIGEFAEHRFGHEVDGQHYSEADQAFFEDLLNGVVREQVGVDETVTAHLAEGWKLSRLDSILRAVLRAGVYELMHRPDVPVKVVINEYLDVANAFFDGGDEPSVVNGVLDKVARHARAREMGKGDGGKSA